MKKMNFKGIMKKVFNEKVKNVIIAALVCVISIITISIVNEPALSMHAAKGKIAEYQEISKKSAKDSEEYTEAMKNYNEASEIYSQESYKYQNYEGFPIVEDVVRFYANTETKGTFYVILFALVLVSPFVVLGGLLIKYIVIPVAVAVNNYVIKPIISFINKVRNIVPKKNKKAIAQ